MRRAAVLVVLALASAAWAGPEGSPGRTPRPAVTPAKPGTQCVAPPAQMRREHMTMLEHQRDDTVRGGIRGAKASLKGCVDCHASPTTKSVAKAPGDFCVACHAYAAVKIDCFDCHASSPKGAAAARTARAGELAPLAMNLGPWLKKGATP